MPNRRKWNIQSISPPEWEFYAKKIDYQGIPIKASDVVCDKALREAWTRLDMMLGRVPDIVANLQAEEVELHIIGKGQATSDLPEHRHRKGRPFESKLDVDQRTRGLGGRHSCCGEENLLRLDADRYRGRDLCVHEFAHTIQSYGLCSAVQKQIATQYRKSLKAGLWKGCYSATNDSEFFAELSMWYFGTHGDPGRIDPRDGPDWLADYDTDAFNLLDQIYTGRLKVGTTRRIVLPNFPPTMEGTIRSQHWRTSSLIDFKNQTSETLTIYWLNYNGARKLCGQILPFGIYSERTYSTHPFVVADQYGSALIIFVAEVSPGIGIIDSSLMPG